MRNLPGGFDSLVSVFNLEQAAVGGVGRYRKVISCSDGRHGDQ